MTMDLSLMILSKYQAVIGVIVGGACTILGSYLSSKKQVNAQREIFDDQVRFQKDVYNDELLQKTEETRWQLKYTLLVDFIANRGSITNRPIEITAADPVKFFNALHRIDIVFYDSDNVIEKNQAFTNSINFGDGMKTEELYDLAIAMYENLGLIPPSEEVFLSPLVINS